jgi:hypothetical protein
MKYIAALILLLHSITLFAFLSTTLNGIAYNIPENGDENWGSDLTLYLYRLPAEVLTKQSSSFTLATETDFGANYGLKALHFRSRTTGFATSGAVQLAYADAIKWRNSTNTADVSLSPASNTVLSYGGVNIVNLSDVQALTNKTLTSPTITGATVTGGTYTDVTLTTPTINDGTLTTVVLNTPTINTATINTPTVNNGDFNTSNLINPTITSGTFNTSTIIAPIVSRGTINNSTWNTGAFYNATLTDPSNVISTATLTGTIATANLPVIPMTKGGLNADVSAYNGLVKISGGAASAISDNSNNWNTAYSWGNHATAGYMQTSERPTFMSTSHVANTITAANIANWNTTYANEVLVAALGTPSQTSVEQTNNNTRSAGRMSGGTVTSNGDGTVNVAAGTGLIRPSNSDTATLYSFNWQTNAVVGLVDNSLNWVTMRYNGGSPFATSTTDLSTVDLNTEFIIAHVYRIGNTTEITMSGAYLPNYVTNNNQRLLYRGIERMTGTAIAEKATRAVTSTVGTWYLGNTKITIPAIDTSVTNFDKVYWLTAAGKYTYQTGQTQIDNTQYNNGTALVALTSTNYTVRWVYICLEGEMYYIYDTLNGSLASAQAATPPATIPDYLEKNALLAGKIIIRRNASTFTSIQSAFTNQFTPVNVNNHNDLANLQGGDGTSYYHFGTANYTALNTIPAGSMLWASSENYIGQIAPNSTAATLFLSQASSGLPAWRSVTAAASGTSGMVQFNNAGVLGSDSTLQWDNTNKRLGIGTTSPTQKLDVAGNIKSSAQGMFQTVTIGTDTPTANYPLTVYSGTHSGIIIEAPAGSNQTLQFISGTSQYYLTHDPADDFLKLYKNTTGTWMAFDGVNQRLGIGTTSPNSTLSINGSYSASYTTLNDGGVINATMNVVYVVSGGVGTTATVSLPACTSSISGREYKIKNFAGGTVLIKGNGSDLVEYAAVQQLSNQGDVIQIQCSAPSGTYSWYKIN